jgi:hypothetical protein
MSLLNFNLTLPTSNAKERRYITDEGGTGLRPHRVYDRQKRQAIICTADSKVAQTMADEFERQWRRSTWGRRNQQRLARLLRKLFTKPTPPPEPTIREKRVAFVQELCDRSRERLAQR